MPKVSPLQSNFNGGEFGDLAQGRVDADRYKTGLAVCENYQPLVQGPITRRSGTRFVAEVKDSTKRTRLVSFEFSTTQAYILEFGHHYIRFYRNNGVIESSPGVPYEVVTSYDESDLFELKFHQSADVLYITHPDYIPARLTRTAHTSWGFQGDTWTDGPYLALNATATTLVASAATGVVTITASSTTGINGGAGFRASDAASSGFGRMLRFQIGGALCWARILAFIDTTHVTATVMYGNAPTVASALWRLGVWESIPGGFPGASVFHEDRLVFTEYLNYPSRIDMSQTSTYETFSPTLTDLTVAANNAITAILNSSDVNAIRWVTSDEKGMLAGTSASEWNIRAASASEAMSPTNVLARQASREGSANVQPIQAGKATLFVQRSGKKFRELVYFYDVDGYRANDMSSIGEHMDGGGFVQLAYAKEPHPTIFLIRQDGVLAAMGYAREVDTLRAPWFRFLIGGNGHADDRTNEFAIVESVACIPSSDNSRYEPWLIVKRYIDGSWVRYVEYIEKNFERGDDQDDAFFVDSGLTYDVPRTITGITSANPAVVTSAAHGIPNGATARIAEVVGMSSGNDANGDAISGINKRSFVVANATLNTFELTGFDSSGLTNYISGGKARVKVSAVSGLDHLEGETVSVLADGAKQTPKTVSGGAISVSPAASVIHVGLTCVAKAQMLRIDAGAADGTALGKTRRTNNLGMLLFQTLGLKIGTNLNGSMDEVVFRKTSDPMGMPTPLFSGIKPMQLSADYDVNNQIAWKQEDPFPGTILAVFPQMTTQDR